MGSHHELIVEISVYGISFHAVEVSGVLLIIVRDNRWVEVDWLVVVLVAMVGGSKAVGIYFLLFLARNESEFTELYSKAEKTILTTDPATGRKQLVDDSSKPVKAAWYSIPVGITIFAMFEWLATI